jgi:hypothetical protein
MKTKESRGLKLCALKEQWMFNSVYFESPGSEGPTLHTHQAHGTHYL